MLRTDSRPNRDMPTFPFSEKWVYESPSLASTGRPRMWLWSLFRTSLAPESSPWTSSTSRQAGRVHVCGGWRRRSTLNVAGSGACEDPSRPPADSPTIFTPPLTSCAEVRRNSAGFTFHPGVPASSIASAMASTTSSSLYRRSRSKGTGTGTPADEASACAAASARKRRASSRSSAVLPAPGAPWNNSVRPGASKPSGAARAITVSRAEATFATQSANTACKVRRPSAVVPSHEPAKTLKVGFRAILAHERSPARISVTLS